jgi:hypothetical protein
LSSAWATEANMAMAMARVRAWSMSVLLDGLTVRDRRG